MSDDEFRGSYSSWRARVPVHWGRSTWDALFLLAADYPHEKECDDDDEMDPGTIRARKAGWRQLLKSLPSVLTCGICSDHFQKYMEHDNWKRLERALQDRESLFKFLYNCKKEVNKRNGRPSLQYHKVRRKYVPPCDRAPTKSRRRKSRTSHR